MGDPHTRSAAFVANLAIPDEDWPDLASDVLLNGEAARSGKLSDGVLLQVGGTVLQFGEKNVEMPTIA
jgi:hypothetical protein